MPRPIVPIEEVAGWRRTSRGIQLTTDVHTGDPTMGKGNHSQKNDKKNKKPKQGTKKPAGK